MSKKTIRKALCCAFVAGATIASVNASAAPTVLTDSALDAVSAGNSIPANAPQAVAFAYAFTQAIDSPGVRAIVNVHYAADAGQNGVSGPGFSHSVTFYP